MRVVPIFLLTVVWLNAAVLQAQDSLQILKLNLGGSLGEAVSEFHSCSTQYSYVRGSWVADVFALEKRVHQVTYREVDFGVGHVWTSDGWFMTSSVYVSAANPSGRWLKPSLVLAYSNRWYELKIPTSYYVGLNQESPDFWFTDGVRTGFRPVKWFSLGYAGRFIKVAGDPWKTDSGPLVAFTLPRQRIELRFFTNREAQVSVTWQW
jgi:hypothetical protein